MPNLYETEVPIKGGHSDTDWQSARHCGQKDSHERCRKSNENIRKKEQDKLITGFKRAVRENMSIEDTNNPCSHRRIWSCDYQARGAPPADSRSNISDLWPTY